MADTPFLDVLSDEQRAIVTKRSRGEKRPSYYDSSVAQAATITGEGTTDGLVQISQDLEAFLILLDSDIKKEILTFIETAGGVATSMNKDDFALMGEVVILRRNNYGQISKDVGEQVLEFDSARSKMMVFLENTARSNLTVPKANRAGGAATQDNPNPDAAAVTAIILPDLGTFFSSLQDSYSVLAQPDELAVHDRISDAGILYTVQNAAQERANELSSWARVFRTYLG